MPHHVPGYSNAHSSPGAFQSKPMYASTQIGKSSVFIWHHRADGAFREALSKHLAMAKRRGNVVTRCQDDLPYGYDANRALQERLHQASVVVLLVSADLLHSDGHYAFLVEAVRWAGQRGIPVLPILIRTCHLHRTPFGHLTALPRDGRPIDTLDRASQEQAWTLIAGEIWGLVDPSVTSSRASFEDTQRSASGTDAAWSSTSSQPSFQTNPLQMGNSWTGVPGDAGYPGTGEYPAYGVYPAGSQPFSGAEDMPFSQVEARSRQGGSLRREAASFSPVVKGRTLWWLSVGALLVSVSSIVIALLIFRSPESEPIPNRIGPLTQPSGRPSTPTVGSTTAGSTPNAPAATAAPLVVVSPARVESSSHLTPNPTLGAFDGDERTAWCEGNSGDGKGEWIQATMPAGSVLREVRLTGGWAYYSPIAQRASGSDGDMWRLSNTATRMLVEWDGGSTTVTFTRADRGVTKALRIPGGASFVKLTILDIARGEAGNNVCLDGLALFAQ